MMFENDIMMFENDIMMFENDIMMFENDIIMFENDIIMFENDIMMQSCLSVCSPSPQLPQVVGRYDHQGHPWLERRSRHLPGLDRFKLENKFLSFGNIPMTA